MQVNTEYIKNFKGPAENKTAIMWWSLTIKTQCLLVGNHKQSGPSWTLSTILWLCTAFFYHFTVLTLPFPRVCVYCSLFFFLSSSREAEIQLLKCVTCYTPQPRHCILAERSVGHPMPCCSFFLLIHQLPLSDHWPWRHIWFIDSKGESKLGWALICFRGMIIRGTLRKKGDW